ncbi:MAG TPA: TSUP family transporter, partial [Longimicrobiaceae bacterium]|nr:TSUP family transporter [Longimicrobiaceae bacterium]
ASAAQLARGHAGEAGAAPERPLRLTLPVTAGTGAAAGTFSALMGVGGGVLMVPLLIHAVGIALRCVAAPSLGVVVITSAAGSAAYMAAGPELPVRPGWSLGYVDLAAAAVLAAGAFLAVRLGTSLNQRLHPRALARLFAALFVLQGAYLVATNLPPF